MPLMTPIHRAPSVADANAQGRVARVLVVLDGVDPGRTLKRTVLARMAEGEVVFDLIVPRTGNLHARQEAEARVDRAIALLGDCQAEVRGRVVDAPAFSALRDAVEARHYDELLVSVEPGSLRSRLHLQRLSLSGMPISGVIERPARRQSLRDVADVYRRFPALR